jgi:protein phosphatase
MGTTTAALVLDRVGSVYTLGNVGDSRIYRWRLGTLEQLTTDDTWLEERIRAGHVKREDARGHPQGHLLTQCLGLGQTPDPRVATGAVEPDDVFLLCSDGLVTCLSDPEIGRVLRDELDGTEEGATRAVESMIGKANAAGGMDNITVVLVSIVPA